MVHLVFDRPSSTLKVFTQGGLLMHCEANGSAWGDGGPNAPYGFQCQIAPGHYLLTQIEALSPPIMSEGAFQIYVADIDDAALKRLVDAGKASYASADILIGGISASIGGLAKYQRTEVMLHGGGSNLGEPECYAPMQPLCRTFGCTRLHNQDLAQLASILQPLINDGQTVVFSVIGDSPELSQ